MNSVEIKNQSNNELFYKIWRNKFLKNEILFHLRIKNKFIDFAPHFSIERLAKYKYKNYLDKIRVKKVFSDISIPPFPFGIREIKFQNSLDFNWLSKFDETTIPTSVHTIGFNDYSSYFNSTVKIIPSSVTCIKFDCDYYKELPKNVFSDNIKIIKFGDFGPYKPFRGGVNVLPPSITSIEFGNFFNQPLKGDWLPPNIKSLKFGSFFKQPHEEIKNYLPKSLTSLILPTNYDFNNLSLPPSPPPPTPTSHSSNHDLEYYFESNSNNLKFDINLIPKSTKILKFDNDFNQTIRLNQIPDSVTSIIFGYKFDSIIDKKNSLPQLNLKSIYFGSKFNRPFNFKLLINLETLILHEEFSIPLNKCQFPPNLKSIKFGFHFKHHIDFKTLPSTLTSLDLDCNADLGSINSIGIEDNNSPIKKIILPNTIKTLTLGRRFNQLIEIGHLPNSLTDLNLGHQFNQPIKVGVLPKSLTSLSFGGSFNQGIEVDSLPNSITYLSFDCHSYDHHFPIGSLPSALKHLIIKSNYFNQDLSLCFDDLNLSLESITINQNNHPLVNILNSNFFCKFIRFIKSF